MSFCGVSRLCVFAVLWSRCAWDVEMGCAGDRCTLVSDPPRMHELAPCSDTLRVCAIYLFTLTIRIPYTSHVRE